MAKMQILGADVNRKTFTISASQTAFPFDFPFFQDEDIRVIHVSDAGVETEKVLTTDFTVTGNVVDEGFQGGQVDLLVAVTDGTVVVFTDTTIERLTSHPDAGPFDTRVLNKDVLKLYQINKEQNIEIDRGIKLSDADQSTSLQLDDPATRALKVLGFSADGLALAYFDGVIDATLFPVTTFGASLLDDANAAAARTTLELGDAATKTVGVADGNLPSATQAEATVASAATTNIGAASSLNVQITGTTTITAFDTVAAGLSRKVRFAAALTLTHNATSLILPGAANITTAANDTAEFLSLGSGNWICLSYKKADGSPVTKSVLQVVETSTSAVSTTTTTIPRDDTLPQNTEGAQILSASITPKSASSTLYIFVQAYCAINSTISLIIALFKDSGADAIAAGGEHAAAANKPLNPALNHSIASGSTASQTFAVRAGADGAGTVTFNGTGGSRELGAIPKTSMIIMEIL